MHIIFGLGAFQTFIFSALLLSKKNKLASDKFLAGFFMVITLYFLNLYSYKFGIWNKFPEIFLIITLVSVSYGPLLYFYVLSLIGKKIKTETILFHLIPIATVFLMIFPYTFHSHEEKLLYFTDKFINLPLNVSLGTFLQYLSAPVYFVWIIQILWKRKKSLKDQLSTIDKDTLDWMLKLLYGGITIWLLDCLNVFALNFTMLIFPYYLSIYIKIVFLIFVLLIGYYGINQGRVFTENSSTLSNEPSKTNKSKHIQKDIAERQSEILLKYMDEEQAYLNSELRLQDISVDLDMPVHVLSSLINNYLNQNFYDFVNTYRVEETKRRLLDPQYKDLTIVAIANDCGFNSKATFNRLFKKYTTMTPTQYKNSK